MSSLTTHDAIELNLEGVQFLESGNCGSAVAAFSKSLSAVKAVLSAYQPPEEDMPSSKFAQAQELIFQFSSTGIDIQRLDLEDSSAAVPFVFKSPITVACTKTATDACSSPDAEFRSLVKFSSTLLFNLALAYHLAGNVAKDPSAQRKKLKKALTFYKLTYTMMQDTMDTGIMETLAIVNNLGHVQHALGDVDKAKQCYEHLLSTIMYVSDMGERDAIQHFDGFFQSVQSTVLASHAPTAQAA
jgi:tetratricopeptide (TPR) repeat protein